MLRRLAGTVLAILLLASPTAAGARNDESGGWRQSLLFLQALDQRLADISWKIRKANVELCPDRAGAIGVTLHDAAQYAPSYRPAAVDAFGFRGGLPAVLAIAKGGPADVAGLKVGDAIAGIDSEALEAGGPSPKAREDYGRVSAVMARLEQLQVGRPVILDIVRSDGPSRLTIPPALVCNGRAEIVPGSAINASSNGYTVQIYGKLALWTRNDDELAIVIAHEMAHNILEHGEKIDRERIGTGLFASLGSDGRKLRDMERDADRYGLYLAARAGYNYAIAAQFWRRLSATSELGGIWGTTHPSAGDRARFNEQVIAEIRDRKAGDLVPSTRLAPNR